MKKNNLFIKIALLVVVLTVATACVVSGTFAKYTTTVLGADTISVARFGYQALDGVAGTAYTKTTAATINLFVDAKSDATGTVAADHLAPGVYGSFVIVLDGSDTEVDLAMTGSTVTASEDIGTLDPAVDAFISYDITYGVAAANTITASYAGGTRATPAAFAAEIQSILAAITLQKSTIGYLMVYWKWVDDADHDNDDTTLGQKWAAGDAPVLKLEISNTATQIMTVSPVYTADELLNPWVVTFAGGLGIPVLKSGTAVQLVNNNGTLTAPVYTNETDFDEWEVEFIDASTTITGDVTFTATWVA